MDITELYFKIDKVIESALLHGESNLSLRLKSAQLQLEEYGLTVWEKELIKVIEWWVTQEKSSVFSAELQEIAKIISTNQTKSEAHNEIIKYFLIAISFTFLLAFSIYMFRK